MRRLFFLMPMLAGLACSRGDRQDEAAKRYLYFTSDFPAGMSWQIVTDFTSTTDSKLCKTISPISGSWVPDRKSAYQDLRASGDTVKVPLFWDRSSPCGWKLSDVSFQDRGSHCGRIHAILLVDKNKRPDGEDKMIPDTLNFVCKSDPITGCWDCDEESGEVNLVYRMESRKATHFHIGIRVK